MFYFIAHGVVESAKLRQDFFVKKKKEPLPKKPLEELSGVYRGNIIWNYFLKKKKLFREIVSGETEKGGKSF